MTQLPEVRVPSAVVGLAAGGSGGHLFPAEALGRELMARGHGVVLYTEVRGARYTQALHGLPHVVLPARSLSGGIVAKVGAAVVITRAMLNARADMQRRGVRALVGFGGYPSFAPALAARSLGLPLLLHEQATRLSLANRQLLRIADGLATSFAAVQGSEAFDPSRITLTGNPVRADILAARGPWPPLDAHTPIDLLVVGGSQGARVFGDVVPPALLALPDVLRTRLRVALQYTGDDGDAVAARLRQAGIDATVAPFFDDMGTRLRDAHLVITRAGATTAADLLAVGRPAIFVPINHGGSRAEQRHNAQSLEAAGVGWCMFEDDFTAEALTMRLAELFDDPARLSAAARAAAARATPDAAARLADVVETLLRDGRGR